MTIWLKLAVNSVDWFWLTSKLVKFLAQKISHCKKSGQAVWHRHPWMPNYRPRRHSFVANKRKREYLSTKRINSGLRNTDGQQNRVSNTRAKVGKTRFRIPFILLEYRLSVTEYLHWTHYSITTQWQSHSHRPLHLRKTYLKAACTMQPVGSFSFEPYLKLSFINNLFKTVFWYPILGPIVL